MDRNNQEPVRGGTRKDPWIPVGHPDFKWTSGANVQLTWYRYTGWLPPSGERNAIPDNSQRLLLETSQL
jgi:hypothetical protein